MEVYYTGKGDVCPVCGGGKIKRPYTGEGTSEQLEEDMNLKFG